MSSSARSTSLLLGYIGALMLKDALVALGYLSSKAPEQRPRHNRWVASLPLRWRFYKSGLYLSPRRAASRSASARAS